MILLKVGSQEEESQSLKKMAWKLSQGRIAAIPTETFYALSADPFNEKAVQRIRSLKGSSKTKPILLLISDPKESHRLSSEIPDIFSILVHAFWPGPLTLIMRSSSLIPPWIDGGTGKIGLRVPGNPLTRKILNHCSFPLTGTSANRSGEQPFQSDEDILHHFEGDLDLLVMGGRLPGGLPSTLLDITGDTPLLLREGQIQRAEIENVLGRDVLQR